MLKLLTRWFCRIHNNGNGCFNDSFLPWVALVLGSLNEGFAVSYCLVFSLFGFSLLKACSFLKRSWRGSDSEEEARRGAEL